MDGQGLERSRKGSGERRQWERAAEDRDGRRRLVERAEQKNYTKVRRWLVKSEKMWDLGTDFTDGDVSMTKRPRRKRCLKNLCSSTSSDMDSGGDGQGDRGRTVPPPTTEPPSLHAAHSLGSPSSPPAPQTLYHAPPSQATYAQRSPFPSPPAPWMIYHARPSPSNVHQTPPDDATSWQTRMFYILEKQNSEMAEMKRMLSSLMKKVATSREEPSSLPERIQFPLASEEDVQALEQDLTDKKTEKALKHHLAVIGGENLKDVTTRIMKTVFSQQLALKYCWTGNARVKRAFQSLKLREVIFTAVRNNEVSKNGTNHEIKHVIQEWFRTASDRDGGRKRRMNRAQAQQDVAEIK